VVDMEAGRYIFSCLLFGFCLPPTLLAFLLASRAFLSFHSFGHPALYIRYFCFLSFKHRNIHTFSTHLFHFHLNILNLYISFLSIHLHSQVLQKKAIHKNNAVHQTSLDNPPPRQPRLLRPNNTTQRTRVLPNHREQHHLSNRCPLRHLPLHRPHRPLHPHPPQHPHSLLLRTTMQHHTKLHERSIQPFRKSLPHQGCCGRIDLG